MAERKEDAQREEHFAHMLAEFGLTESAMHDLAQIASDVIEFPLAVKVTVAPSRIYGHGLFATHPITAGEVIAPAVIARTLTPAGRYTNHAKAHHDSRRRSRTPS